MSQSIRKSWWKEGVIYQIYPRSFKDSNGDGVGDLRGIIQQLDYLKKLGVDILWLSPVFKSPNDDNGYDISDYCGIMDEFGTMDDFDELLEGVHQRGMKLLMDLVVNHSSDEHYWFQESRKSKDNPYRDYYYWKPEKPNNWKSFFGGDVWEKDELTGEYYLHLFTKKQPDLNWENPNVRKEIYDLMHFWLKKGIDGFRMDVIPLISKRLAFEDADISDFGKVIDEAYANGPRVHEFIQEMHREVLQHYDIMTVGEGPGISREIAPLYVGEDRNELNMIFHFGHMFMDHGEGGRFDPVPLSFVQFKKVFSEWDEVIRAGGWINIFLDNHDFPRLVSRWGNDREYRVESAKLLATLLLTMRGTPCIYQGSEIGMTNVAFDSIDDYRDVEIHNFYQEHMANGGDPDEFLRAVHVQGRDNVRTPMHWDASKNAGFTDGTPWIKVNPNYSEINAEAVLNDPDSIFYFYQKMLQYRRANPTLIYGEFQDLVPDDESLFIYERWDENDRFLMIHNFSEHLFSFSPEASGDESWQLEISNYTSPSTDLRAWESRVYRKLAK